MSKRRLEQSDESRKKQKQDYHDDQACSLEEDGEDLVTLTNGKVEIKLARDVLKANSRVLANILEGDTDTKEIKVNDLTDRMLILFQKMIQAQIDYSQSWETNRPIVNHLIPHGSRSQTVKFYEELIFAISKYDLIPFSDFFLLYYCKYKYLVCYNCYDAVWNSLIKYQMSEKFRFAYRKTHWRRLEKMSVKALRSWPRRIVNSFMDEAIEKDKLTPLRSGNFYGFIKYAEITGDAQIKKRIKDRIETFSEVDQRRLKIKIFNRIV